MSLMNIMMVGFMVLLMVGFMVLIMVVLHHGKSAQSGGIHHSLFRAANWIIKGLLRLGIPLGPMTLLTVRGRKTGEPHTTPVDRFERAGRSFLVSTHGGEGSNWVRNLRAAGEGMLSLGHRRENITAVEMAPEAAAPVLKEGLGPRLALPIRGFVLRRTLGVGPGASSDDFLMVARSHPVFEVGVSAKPPSQQ
jgi:deazaflavin-dependent oxidoreductase (nitroreductase family)